LGSSGAAARFADRLAARVEQRESQIVLGLDPDPGALWPAALSEAGAGPAAAEEPEADDGVGVAELAAAAVERHCALAIEAAGEACVAVKLQLACYERLGAPGWRALEATVWAAREHGLLVIADGKRGDVPVSAHAYAEALVGSTPSPFGDVPGLGADAFTANPLLGADALEPLVDGAAEVGAGCFVLVRTSNPGAGEIQDRPSPVRPLHERLAALVDVLGRGSVGACGLSSVGAVIGATRPDLLARLRALMPRAVLLLPGVGAQGGTVDDLRPAFGPHPAAGLVTASRSIVGAVSARGGDPAEAARAAADELRTRTWRIAVAGVSS
jgi:orotidine-5'-phosphate decarboxylase